jgi:hypothetical protein
MTVKGALANGRIWLLAIVYLQFPSRVRVRILAATDHQRPLQADRISRSDC